MKKTYKVVLVIFLVIVVFGVITNPSKEDFEEFLPSVKSDILNNKTGRNFVQVEAVNIARVKNYFLFSVWEVDLKCLYYPYGNAEVVTKSYSYYGGLGNFYKIED